MIPRALANASAAILLMILTIGCSDQAQEVSFMNETHQNPPELTLRAQYHALRHANPRVDAQESYKKGDYRLVGVLGFTLIVPGIEQTEKYESGLKIVALTADFSGGLHPEVNEYAAKYASAYNKKLIALLDEMPNKQE